jgi:hypothetical protein
MSPQCFDQLPAASGEPPRPTSKRTVPKLSRPIELEGQITVNECIITNALIDYGSGTGSRHRTSFPGVMGSSESVVRCPFPEIYFLFTSKDGVGE